MRIGRDCFLQLSWSTKTYFTIPSPQKKGWIRCKAPIHPSGQVDNATASSAGVSGSGWESGNLIGRPLGLFGGESERCRC